MHEPERRYEPWDYQFWWANYPGHKEPLPKLVMRDCIPPSKEFLLGLFPPTGPAEPRQSVGHGRVTNEVAVEQFLSDQASLRLPATRSPAETRGSPPADFSLTHFRWHAGMARLRETLELSDEGSTRTTHYRYLEKGTGPFEYVMFSGHYFDTRIPANSDWFIGESRKVAREFKPKFAFAEDSRSFAHATVDDPRARAWGVTFYGHQLVDMIGAGKFDKLPAWKVEDDPDLDGKWVWLSPLPFVFSEEMERRRLAVEWALDITRHFPDH